MLILYMLSEMLSPVLPVSFPPTSSVHIPVHLLLAISWALIMNFCWCCSLCLDCPRCPCVLGKTLLICKAYCRCHFLWKSTLSEFIHPSCSHDTLILPLVQQVCTCCTYIWYCLTQIHIDFSHVGLSSRGQGTCLNHLFLPSAKCSAWMHESIQ